MAVANATEAHTTAVSAIANRATTAQAQALSDITDAANDGLFQLLYKVTDLVQSDRTAVLQGLRSLGFTVQTRSVDEKFAGVPVVTITQFYLMISW